MPNPKTTEPHALSRRQATSGILVALGGLMVGCGDNSSGGSGLTDASAAGAGGSSTGDTGSAASWASGGTKSMTGSYADPFTSAVTTCQVGATATQGPCTEAADQVRKDISEGYTGLPMRLALKVVDSACQAVAGAKVKVWHTQISGSYSGDTPNNNMCLKDAADSAKHYFRGVQTTDANGRVDFDSCFPGWYRGRAVHIHYTVSLGGSSYTSQLVFDQTLVNEIFTSHTEYKSYGLPDTPNATDNVVAGNVASFTLTTARMADGAMMASKILAVNLA